MSTCGGGAPTKLPHRSLEPLLYLGAADSDITKKNGGAACPKSSGHATPPK
jgi:hypothetical protein